MHLYDAVSLGDGRMTRDGYMVASARIARTGVQDYLGRELGRPDLGVVRVLRPEEEVFHADALASLAHRPVTVDHPAEPVAASNWKSHAVGMTGDHIARDGGWIRVPLTLMDASAIETVRGGKRQLSVGYSCDLDWTAGQTADGHPYDAVQRNIRGNHLAIVDAARAGPGANLGDRTIPTPTRTESPLKVILIDGISVEFSPQGAEAVEKLQRQLGDSRTALQAKDGEIAALTATHAAALSATAGEITARDARLSDMEAKLAPAAIEAAVAERATLLSAARRVLGDSYDGAGQSAPDIRKAVVAHRLGDRMPADADVAFVDAAFRFLDLTADAAPAADPIRSAVRAPVADSRAAAAGSYEDTFRLRAGEGAA